MPEVIDVPEVKPARGNVKIERLPRYAVVLHNDDIHSMEEVVLILMEIFGFPMEEATQYMMEAHMTGRSTVMVTHQERAELYRDKMRSKTLVATIERID